MCECWNRFLMLFNNVILFKFGRLYKFGYFLLLVGCLRNVMRKEFIRFELFEIFRYDEVLLIFLLFFFLRKNLYVGILFSVIFGYSNIIRIGFFIGFSFRFLYNCFSDDNILVSLYLFGFLSWSFFIVILRIFVVIVYFSVFTEV